MKKILLALSITAVLAFSAARYGLTHHLLSAPQLAIATNAGTAPAQSNTNTLAKQVEVNLLFGDDQAMYLKSEKRVIAQSQESLAKLIVEELIKGPTLEGLTRTLPQETKVLSVKVDQGIATVNLSKEAQTKHWGGSAGENMTVYSIVDTLTQLPQIDKVQFLIAGEQQEAIWGNIYTMEPISPNQSLIAH